MEKRKVEEFSHGKMEIGSKEITTVTWKMGKERCLTIKMSLCFKDTGKMINLEIELVNNFYKLTDSKII